MSLRKEIIGVEGQQLGEQPCPQSGGLYHFASWNVGLNAKVHFQAPSEVRIAGALLVNQNGYVGLTPGMTDLEANSIVIHVAGTDGQSNPGNFPKAVTVEQNGVVTAYVVAPSGLVNFRQNVKATGAFIGTRSVLQG